MQGRSWMAALALAAGVALVAARPATRAGETPAVVNKVTLDLRIAGLGPKGCEVEIKPGHPLCDSSRSRRRHVRRQGAGQADARRDQGQVDEPRPRLHVRDHRQGARPAAADRPPGHPARRPDAPAPRRPSRPSRCYLRSPSLAAKDDAERRVKSRWPDSIRSDPLARCHGTQDRLHDVPAVDGQALVAAVAGEGQALVVEAEQVEDRRVQVVDVDLVLDRAQAELVGRA